MRIRAWLLAASVLAVALPAWAQQKPVKIAIIEDQTGPLEAYAKQSLAGFRLGLEYATHGTNTRRRPQDRGDREGQPDQAGCRAQPARRGLWRR